MTLAELACAPVVMAPPRAAPQPAVEAWMHAYEPELRRHLARLVGSADDADDLLQQVWITAHRSPPDTGPGSNVRAWLFRVATNAALDRLARERRRRIALAHHEAKVIPEAPPPPDADDASAARLDARARSRVRDHVARLPRKQRQAVWLRWAEGLDYDTIAARLGCSTDSARANVYQAMKRLRAELADLRESRTP